MSLVESELSWNLWDAGIEPRWAMCNANAALSAGLPKGIFLSFSNSLFKTHRGWDRGLCQRSRGEESRMPSAGGARPGHQNVLVSTSCDQNLLPTCVLAGFHCSTLKLVSLHPRCEGHPKNKVFWPYLFAFPCSVFELFLLKAPQRRRVLCALGYGGQLVRVCLSEWECPVSM